MGHIKLDELSTSLKEYIANLGLTEEQVNELIQNVTGDMSTLQTTEKTVAGAINELFQSANNGKELIATAIGEPLTAEDTFSAMSNGINNLLSTFKANMMNNGVSVTGTDKFKQLIDKLATLADSEGKGIKYATGICTQSSYSSGEYDSGTTYTINIQTNLTFVPDVIFVRMGYNNVGSTSNVSNKSNLYVSNLMEFNEDYTAYSDINKISINNITKEGFQINVTTSRDSTGLFNDWYAIGVGEEDTTLRDSLASILEEEGVSVAPEDDMVNLISKTDEEFNKKNNTISGLEGEIANKNNTISRLEGEIKNNRDSLASILQDEGVSVTTGDNLASLITKVDNEFDNKNRKIESNKINIITASKLPSTVVNNQVVLLNKSETSLPIVLTDRFNANPSTNTEINIATVNTANGFNFNQTINNVKLSYYLEAAIQKVNNKIISLDGYLGVNNTWKQFSKNGIIFYMNGVDSENLSGASSINNNDIYTGYYINTVNSNNVLNVSTDQMGQDITAYIAYKNPYNLTDYSTLEITYSKGAYSFSWFYFGFSKSYERDHVSLEKLIKINQVPTDIVTKTVDVSSLTGTYYFAIMGRASTSSKYDINIHSIKLY